MLSIMNVSFVLFAFTSMLVMFTCVVPLCGNVHPYENNDKPANT